MSIKTIETINIRILTEKFLDDSLEVLLNGFILNFSKNNYLVTVHHNLPISNIYDEYDKRLHILINSVWSETLVLDLPDDIELTNYAIYDSYQNKLPKINSILELKNSKIELTSLIVINYEFHPFDNIQNDYLIPYIVVRFCEEKENILGLSGSPIFINNKLIGVFSKYNHLKKVGYILPIYIIIKNLTKKDNNIYKINEKNIIKINSYKVKEDYIYHPTMQINIPLTSYFLLEGDINKEINIQYENIYKINERVFFNLDNNLQISNENNIINVLGSNNYKINSRLLALILKLNQNMVLEIFNKIIVSQKELWLKIDNGKITFD
jgi:hypothetical protein